MSGLATITRNLPNNYAERFQKHLDDRTKDLTQGLNFTYEDKVWSVQVMNNGDAAFVRMSSDEVVHAWIFRPETDKSPQLIQTHLIATPTQEVVLTEDASRKDNYKAETDPLFLQLENLCETHHAPKLDREVHAYAKKWFEENNVPSALLPASLPPTKKISPGDPMTKKVNEEIFLKFFKGLLAVTALYYVYRFACYFFQKTPAPVAIPKAILTE